MQLTKEIIKRIILDQGVVPGQMFTEAGLASKSLLYRKDISIQYDTIVVNHNVFSGKLNIGTGLVNGILVDLSFSNVNEYIFIYEIDSIISCVKMVFNSNNEDDFGFKTRDGNTWKDASIYTQALALAGFEQVNSLGIIWEKNDEINGLFDLLKELI